MKPSLIQQFGMPCNTNWAGALAGRVPLGTRSPRKLSVGGWMVRAKNLAFWQPLRGGATVNYDPSVGQPCVNKHVTENDLIAAFEQATIHPEVRRVSIFNGGSWGARQ